ncbi:glycoside hydrolase family 65 protein [Desertimonas flava]|uniref:glycoside hydrolase family 65 protein n=1 Tax=Desertimonas flava TaxID=2064846 RepID=UPI000E34B573|nr:glycosyl hydrolase family 65 protein [Desertimonas flava]
MTPRSVPDQLPQHRFPVDEWRFIEREYDESQLPLTATLFALGNGYLGLRGDHEEGRDANDPGTYVNGFHETWSIHHAEDAFGFATTGQTIVNVPDAKIMSLYVDDEPFDLAFADLEHYERVLDLRAGTLVRDVTWRTSSGKLIRVRSERLVSLAHRHIAAIRFEVTMLHGSAPVLVTSRLLNRQDAEFDADPGAFTEGMGTDRPERDPRRHRTFNHRVLQSRVFSGTERQLTLGYQCTNSQMSIACAARHEVESDADLDTDVEVAPSDAALIVTGTLGAGESLRITKFVAYHTSRYAPGRDAEVLDDADELVVRCNRSLDRVEHQGFDALVSEQSDWLDTFWDATDVKLHAAGPAAATQIVSDQQALRWNLFQLAQASAQSGEHGIAAKGVTGGGYEGHYFWDTEMYVAPFLSYTAPEKARQLLRFRWRMLPVARQRATALNQVGALYPWRTINGEEASAYYAAGTAQYHINAAVAFAVKRYVDASGDVGFLAGDGAEVLVETARLWNDLGFYTSRLNGHGRAKRVFRIHGVTGPDEYTAVVNDNLYTNVMARFNLRYAARVLELLGEVAPDALAAVRRRVDLADGETDEWIEAAESMYLPYDAELGIHPQDSDFLEREPWDFANTPPDKYPLLLHFHPLVIYRHQVLKQADVVLAVALRNDQFSADVRRRNFDYYDPITTGDSSLSACVQAMAAAQIGYEDLAVRYFREALYVDLADLHGNTRDGVHVASCGGVWGTVAFGFAGLFETGTALSFDPILPPTWDGLTFRIQRHGSRLRVDLDPDGCTVTVVDGHPVPIHVTAGFTGLSPEPSGPEEIAALAAAAEEALAADGSLVVNDDDSDRVVLVEAGQSIYIAGTKPTLTPP